MSESTSYTQFQKGKPQNLELFFSNNEISEKSLSPTTSTAAEEEIYIGPPGTEEVKELTKNNGFEWFSWTRELASPPHAYINLLNYLDIPKKDILVELKEYETYKNDYNTTISIPRFSYAKYNPHVLYSKMRSTAHRTTQKLTNTLKYGSSASLTLTFPKEVSNLFYEYEDKSNWEDRLWKVYKDFISDFESYLQKDRGINDLNLLQSATPHTWKSEFPFKPHAHFHVIIPMLSSDFPSKKKNTKFLYNARMELHKLMKYQINFSDYSNPDLKEIPESWEGYLKHIHNELNDIKSSFLNVQKIPFFGPGKPFSENIVKRIWNRAILSEFEKELSGLSYSNNFVLNIDLINSKPRLLHKIKYKSRSPLIDIAKHLKGINSVKGFLKHHNIDWDFLDYLVHYSNRTRVFGPWKALSNLSKYSLSKISAFVCPFTGSDMHKTGYITPEDYLSSNHNRIIQNRNGSIMIYKSRDSRDPPPDDPQNSKPQKNHNLA